MSKKIISFQQAYEDTPHEVNELWCNNCGKALVTVHKTDLKLNTTCPRCGCHMRFMHDITSKDVLYFISRMTEKK